MRAALTHGVQVVGRGRVREVTGRALGLSVHTVRTQLKSVCRRLRAHGRTEALSRARGSL